MVRVLMSLLVRSLDALGCDLVVLFEERWWISASSLDDVF